MASSERNENSREEGSSAVGWTGALQEQYRKIKENAEAFPYVWASYILVYGGFALWTTYRFRKLRWMEDRVRILQEGLRKVVEAEESATLSAISVKKCSPSSSSSVVKSDPAVDDITK